VGLLGIVVVLTVRPMSYSQEQEFLRKLSSLDVIFLSVLQASGGGDVWRQKADLLLARAAEAKSVLAGHPSTGPKGSASFIKTQQLLEILQTSNSFESSNSTAQNFTFELNDPSVPVESHQFDFDIMLIGTFQLLFHHFSVL
jgi:hypothetical protein